jgi:membrane protease YdiL (CAAX protease family)
MDTQQEVTSEITVPTSCTAIEKRQFNMLMIAGIALPIMLFPYLTITLLFAVTDFSWYIFLSRLLLWLVLGGLYLYAKKGEMQNMLLWPQEHYKPVFYIKWFFLLYLLYIAVAFISRIPFWLGFHENNAVIIKLYIAMQKSPALLIFGALTAGIAEEFIFRGYILSRLSLLFSNKHSAVITSAAIFALAHLSYHTFHELIFVFGIGIVFAYHYQKYHNLTILMVVHFLIDAIALGIHKIPHLH